MKSLKKLYITLIAAILIVAASPVDMFAQRGAKAAGASLGYVTKNKSAGASLFFQYSFSDHVRVVPQVGCVFRHNNLDAFVIDVDAQLPYSFGSETVSLYPIAGLDYSSWNFHAKADSATEGDNDVSTRRSRLGVNLGAGVEMKLTSSMKAFFETKYTLTKRYSTAKLSVGLAYMF